MLCKSKTFLFMLMILAGVSLFISCDKEQPDTPQSTLTSTKTDPRVIVTSNTKTLKELPQYLKQIWPAPHSTISKQEYDEGLNDTSMFNYEVGIGVILYPESVAEVGDIDIYYPDRSTIFIDGTLIHNDICKVADGITPYETFNEQGKLLTRVGGPYYLTWCVPLQPGEHIITYQIKQTSGNVMEYTWPFTITP